MHGWMDDGMCSFLFGRFEREGGARARRAALFFPRERPPSSRRPSPPPLATPAPFFAPFFHHAPHDTHTHKVLPAYPQNATAPRASRTQSREASPCSHPSAGHPAASPRLPKRRRKQNYMVLGYGQHQPPLGNTRKQCSHGPLPSSLPQPRVPPPPRVQKEVERARAPLAPHHHFFVSGAAPPPPLPPPLLIPAPPPPPSLPENTPIVLNSKTKKQTNKQTTLKHDLHFEKNTKWLGDGVLARALFFFFFQPQRAKKAPAPGAYFSGSVKKTRHAYFRICSHTHC
jgi:hypothetical protein